MNTILEALFPTKITAQKSGPLIDAATKIFTEHWTGASGVEILVPDHNLVELVAGACTKRKANIRRADASATHAAELQAHVTVLEERIANPTKEQARRQLLKWRGPSHVGHDPQ